MSRSSYLFAGIFGTFAISCLALVVAPQVQIGNLQPQVDPESGDAYPIANPQKGREVYASEGCFYCHTQQIRDEQNGLDIERGWGPRRTVARDYIFTQPSFLGTMRLGPDLTNVGSADWRNEGKDDPRKPARRNTAWHYLHLYQPTAVVKESNMPPYRYLFETRKIGGQRSLDALNVPIKAGYEVVPRAEARQLVSYLMSLDRTHPLNEVKAPASAPAPAK
jgi:cytochrome c oxidase cbb3-type subunit 2